MGNFKNGDKVRINAVNHIHHDVQGTVSRVFEDGVTYLVDLEIGKTSGFFEKELELVDPAREPLIRLAETLDKARLQANAIDEAAPQSGVYGVIRVALVDALNLIVDDYDTAKDVYASIMEDGNSVREALAAVERNKEV